MDTAMEFVIYHDGKNWCLSNAQLTIASPTMAALDDELIRLMRQKGMVKSGERRKVRMMFDNSTLPPVIRQYAQHYFNRVLEVEG